MTVLHAAVEGVGDPPWVTLTSRAFVVESMTVVVGFEAGLEPLAPVLISF